MSAVPRLRHNFIGLVAELGGQLPVRSQHLPRRKNLFLVTGGVGSDLCRFMTLVAAAFQILPYLLCPRTRSVQILLCVTFDLRRTAAAGLKLVAEVAQPVGKLGLVDGGSELLRLKEAAFLQGTGLPILTFGHIEDDRVGVELRGGVTVNRAGCIVLEFCGDELARSLGSVVATDPGLGIALQFV